MSDSAGNSDWDAVTYDRISAPQFTWASEQIDSLELTGNETVLDAGCGSGKVTALLVDRVPEGHVYAVDMAPSMVEHTRKALGDRVTVSCQDLADLTLPEQVDAIFSNATFHWVMDHDRLFTALYAALKPGGRIVAQCGGYGNIRVFRVTADEVATTDPRFAPYFHERKLVWNYQTAEATKERLQNAGFVNVETWLEPRPTVIEDATAFVRTVCLVRHLDSLPADMHDTFIEAVLGRLDSPLMLDYVRLNMTARAPATA